MPKWTEYTSKNTLADNDEVMLYDATGKANKRGLMSKFWDYVVDKMSTAVISKLETKNKTVIGAINALNSESTISSGIINRSITFPISKMHSMVLLCVGDPNGSSIIAIRVGDTGIQGTQLLAGNNTKFTYACVNKKITVTAEENLNYYGRYIAIS